MADEEGCNVVSSNVADTAAAEGAADVNLGGYEGASLEPRSEEIQRETNTDIVYAADEGQVSEVMKCEEAKSDDTGLEENKSDACRSEALLSYWSAVNKTPSDFTAWTYLLQFVEQEDNMPHVREAFDGFLEHYPYCYGYWKKYADIECKHGNLKEAYDVYVKGTKAVPLSVDLWLHFITFVSGGVYTTEEMRSLFDQALSAAGMDFRSDKLWDKYVEWEMQRGDLKGVTNIYMRLLSIPTQLYSHHYESFKRHMEGHSVIEVLEEKEIEKWREANKSGGEAAGHDAPPGLEASAVTEMSLFELLDPVEAVAIKARVMEKYTEIYRRNEEEVSKRWNYEEGIRRPYFHVKALEKGQLKNWHDYLDFEMENGNQERILVLFERCLIACALYEEFWLKYANYLDAIDPANTRNVYRRACTIHLPRKASLHLAWAFFEERQGDPATARQIVDRIEDTQPQSLSILIHKLNLYRRSGIDINSLYKQYVEQASSLEVGSFLAIKWARYLAKVKLSTEEARAVLTEQITKNPSNEQLYLQLLDLEFQQVPLSEARILSVFEQAESCATMSDEHRHMFINRKYEFLEDYGSSISKLYEVYLAANAVNSNIDATDGKRKLEGVSEDESEQKKAKMDYVNGDGIDYSGSVNATQSYTNVADPNASYYNQWQGYGGYYQGGYPQSWSGYGYSY